MSARRALKLSHGVVPSSWHDVYEEMVEVFFDLYVEGAASVWRYVEGTALCDRCLDLY